MKQNDSNRLALDVLISGVFAVCAALVRFLVGLLLAFAITPLIFRNFFPSDCECPVLGFIPLMIIAVPTFIGGAFGFPLCGIWLDQRRQKRKLQPTP